MMKELFYKIEESLKSTGIYSDRQNFVPHITLGRIEKIVSKPFFQRLMQKHKNVEGININVDSIVLLESKRVGDGVEYIELGNYEI
jgi:2'-5' RNA ligase